LESANGPYAANKGDAKEKEKTASLPASASPAGAASVGSASGTAALVPKTNAGVGKFSPKTNYTMAGWQQPMGTNWSTTAGDGSGEYNHYNADGCFFMPNMLVDKKNPHKPVLQQPEDGSKLVVHIDCCKDRNGKDRMHVMHKTQRKELQCAACGSRGHMMSLCGHWRTQCAECGEFGHTKKSPFCANKSSSQDKASPQDWYRLVLSDHVPLLAIHVSVNSKGTPDPLPNEGWIRKSLPVSVVSKSSSAWEVINIHPTAYKQLFPGAKSASSGPKITGVLEAPPCLIYWNSSLGEFVLTTTKS